jgi:hypothetical protein
VTQRTKEDAMKITEVQRARIEKLKADIVRVDKRLTAAEKAVAHHIDLQDRLNERFQKLDEELMEFGIDMEKFGIRTI